jgi:hypothetical protein
MSYESSLLQRQAAQAVANAVKRGKLAKPTDCARCGPTTRRIEAHHCQGYAPEHRLHVEWLCSRCHALVRPKRRRTTIDTRIARVAKSRKPRKI